MTGSLPTQFNGLPLPLRETDAVIGGLPAGNGFPSGGTIGQIVAKRSSTNFDIYWRDEPWVNVKDFGAKGDGITDDTAAIQAAITSMYASSGGGTIFFPASTGEYIASNLLIGWQTVLQGAASFYGVGTGEQPRGSVLKMKNGATGDFISPLGGGTSKYVNLRDLTLDGNKTNTAGQCTGIGGSWANTKIERCRIVNFATRGLRQDGGQLLYLLSNEWISNGSNANYTDGGVLISGSECIVDKNWFAGNHGHGLLCGSGSIDMRVTSNLIEGFTAVPGDAFFGLMVEFAQRVHIIGNSVRGFNGGIWMHKGCSRTKIIGNYFGNNSFSQNGIWSNIVIEPSDTPIESIIISDNDFAVEQSTNKVKAHIEIISGGPTIFIDGISMRNNDFSPQEADQPTTAPVIHPIAAQNRSLILDGNRGQATSPVTVSTAVGASITITNTTHVTSSLAITTTTARIITVIVNGVTVFSGGGSGTAGWQMQFSTPSIAPGASVILSTDPTEIGLTTKWIPVSN